MTSITPNVWHPVGLDVTRDGYKGRLGVSYKTGQVVAAGASNGLLSRLPMHLQKPGYCCSSAQTGSSPRLTSGWESTIRNRPLSSATVPRVRNLLSVREAVSLARPARRAISR